MIDARKLLLPPGGAATPIHVVAKAEWPRFRATLPEAAQGWAKSHGYEAAPLLASGCSRGEGRSRSGARRRTWGARRSLRAGRNSRRLPEGRFTFAERKHATLEVALGWAGELYKYDPFRRTKVKAAELVLPSKGLAETPC